MEDSYRYAERADILARFAAVRAPILALAMADDIYATPSALLRTLSYFDGSERRMSLIDPGSVGEPRSAISRRSTRVLHQAYGR